MTYLLKQIFNFLKILNSDTGENQIAAGISCGLILGFAPFFSLQTLVAIIVLFFFRIQIGAAMSASLVFSLIAFLIDPLAHQLGSWFLQLPSLTPTLTHLYHMPIVPFTRFNNTIVMGSLLISLFLFPFVFFVSRIVIIRYRVLIVDRFQQTKFWKAITATRFYKWYASYQELYG